MKIKKYEEEETTPPETDLTRFKFVNLYRTIKKKKSLSTY